MDDQAPSENATATPMLAVVRLWLAGDDVAAFEAFERRAAEAMAPFGGSIDTVVRLDPAARAAGAPFEIHVVRFPGRGAFESYRRSRAAEELAAERSRVIARTEIELGTEGDRYSDR